MKFQLGYTLAGLILESQRFYDNVKFPSVQGTSSASCRLTSELTHTRCLLDTSTVYTDKMEVFYLLPRR